MGEKSVKKDITTGNGEELNWFSYNQQLTGTGFEESQEEGRGWNSFQQSCQG